MYIYIYIRLQSTSLYSYINKNEAIKECIGYRTNKEPAAKVVSALLHHIFTLNDFNFNGWMTFSPNKLTGYGNNSPYQATINVGRFEAQYGLYTLKLTMIVSYNGSIDGIFLVYTGEDARLQECLTKINTKQGSIEFEDKGITLREDTLKFTNGKDGTTAFPSL